MRPSTKVFLPGLTLVLLGIHSWLNSEFEMLPESIGSFLSEVGRIAFLLLGATILVIGVLIRWFEHTVQYRSSSRRYDGIRLSLRG